MSAGNGIIGALLVSLGIDTAAFETGLKQAETKATAFGSAMSAIGQVAMAGLITAVAAGGAAFVKFGGDALATADDIGDAAARIGVSAEAFQKLGIAATAAGGTPELMTEAMDKLNENLGAFRQDGGGKAAKAFEQLGLAGKLASGDIATADKAFYAIASQMEKIEDPAVKARLAMQLFGKSAGVDMLEVLAAGADALKGYGEAAQNSGRIMSDEMVEKLAAAKLALDNTTTAAGQMATVFAGQAVVAIVDMAKELSPLWEQAKALYQQVYNYLMPSVQELGQTFLTFATGPAGQAILGTMGFLAKLMGETVVNSVRLTISIFNGLFQTLDAVGKFLAPIINKIGQAFAWLKPLIQGVVNAIAPATGGFKFMATEVAGTVPPMIEGVATQFGKLPAVMTSVVESETDKAGKAFEALKSKIDSLRLSYGTADENADAKHRKDIDQLNEAWRGGVIKTREEYEELKRRIDAAREAAYGITKPEVLTKKDLPYVAIDYDPEGTAARKAADKMREAMSEAYKDVGYAAKQVMLDVIEDGKVNWRSLISYIVDNWSSVSKVISDMWNSFKVGSSGGGGIFSGLGTIFSSIFSASPKFANGGTVGIKGGGPTDSRLFSAWVSPDEIINIGQAEDMSGGLMRLVVEPSQWFDVRAAAAGEPTARRYSTEAAQVGASGGAQLARAESARRSRRVMEG